MNTKEANRIADAAEVLSLMPIPTPGPFRALPPNLTSTLDEIGQWVQQSFKTSAEDAWDKGRAFKLAKAKSNRNFGKWCKRWVPFLGERTIQRYMQVAELPKDEVNGLDVSEVYRLLQGEPKPNKDTEPNKPEENKTETTNTTENKPEENKADAGPDKAARLLEAIQTLTELTTSPGEWKDEIAANLDALKMVPNKVLEILN